MRTCMNAVCDRQYSACVIVICRARAAELEVGTYYCPCAIHTKWRLIHPETPVELSVSLFDSFAEFICSKGSI